jgi:hypothetical protein
MKKWLGKKMRTWADRMDPDGAPRLIGYSFTFEKGEGIRFRKDRKGCRLAYLGKDEYDKAWSESDTQPLRIPWTVDTLNSMRAQMGLPPFPRKKGSW